MKKILLPCLLFLSISTSAYGYGCDCGSMQTMFTTSDNNVTSSINSNTTAQAEAIIEAVETASTNIIGTLQTQTKTLVSALQLLKEEFHKTIKSTSITEQLINIEDVYGNASQPDLLCGGSNVGAGIQVSVQASEILRNALRENQIAYSNNENAKAVDFINRVLSDHPSVEEMVVTMRPDNHTLTDDEVILANETIKTLANPFPLPMLTSEQLATSAGEGYEIARVIEEGKKGVAMDALNENVAHHSPTLPTDITTWATEQWNASGATGTVTGVVDGKMSQAGLFALMSQLRTGNPNWIANISKMTNMGVAREQLFIDALNFEVQRQNNELLQRLVVLTALHYTHVIGQDESSKKAYNHFISNEQ